MGKWTTSEVAQMRKMLAEGKRYQDIAEVLGRTWAAVEHKAITLGINPMPQRVPKVQGTLCWTCEKAVGLCAWSRAFLPVDGWDALKEEINAGGRSVPSYTVLNCPQFVEG